MWDVTRISKGRGSMAGWGKSQAKTVMQGSRVHLRTKSKGHCRDWRGWLRRDSEVLVHLLSIFFLSKQWEVIELWRKYMGMWGGGSHREMTQSAFQLERNHTDYKEQAGVTMGSQCRGWCSAQVRGPGCSAILPNFEHQKRNQVEQAGVIRKEEQPCNLRIKARFETWLHLLLTMGSLCASGGFLFICRIDRKV